MSIVSCDVLFSMGMYDRPQKRKHDNEIIIETMLETYIIHIKYEKLVCRVVDHGTSPNENSYHCLRARGIRARRLQQARTQNGVPRPRGSHKRGTGARVTVSFTGRRDQGRREDIGRSPEGRGTQKRIDQRREKIEQVICNGSGST